MDFKVSVTTSDSPASPQYGKRDTSEAFLERGDTRRECHLDAVETVDGIGAQFEVTGIDGSDAVGQRLAASGLWDGAVVEHIASAPFGDPMLFRVHGYRLALRRSEAARVRVVEVR